MVLLIQVRRGRVAAVTRRLIEGLLEGGATIVAPTDPKVWHHSPRALLIYYVRDCPPTGGEDSLSERFGAKTRDLASPE
jgi:hypothetical protein